MAPDLTQRVITNVDNYFKPPHHHQLEAEFYELAKRGLDQPYIVPESIRVKIEENAERLKHKYNGDLSTALLLVLYGGTQTFLEPQITAQIRNLSDNLATLAHYVMTVFGPAELTVGVIHLLRSAGLRLEISDYRNLVKKAKKGPVVLCKKIA